MYVYISGEIMTYYEIRTTHLVWTSARDDCAGSNGHLMSVQTPDQYNSAIFYASALGQDFWIGANDRTTNNQWIWDSELTPVSDDYWAHGNPINADQNCAIFRVDEFYNEVCSNPRAYVCQFYSIRGAP